MFSVVRTLEWPISSATIFSGTPLSCAQEQYVRRNVSQVVRGSLNSSQAENTHRRKMLFGEIGFPDRVQKIKLFAPFLFARAFQWIRRAAVLPNLEDSLRLLCSMG